MRKLAKLSAELELILIQEATCDFSMSTSPVLLKEEHHKKITLQLESTTHFRKGRHNYLELHSHATEGVSFSS